MIEQVDELGADAEEIGRGLLLIAWQRLALKAAEALRSQRHQAIACVEIVAVVGRDLVIDRGGRVGLGGFFQQPRLGVKPLLVAEGVGGEVQGFRGEVAEFLG
jgi:hypothetical protein